MADVTDLFSLKLRRRSVGIVPAGGCLGRAPCDYCECGLCALGYVETTQSKLVFAEWIFWSEVMFVAVAVLHGLRPACSRKGLPGHAAGRG
jgi:hypothetical protein